MHIPDGTLTYFQYDAELNIHMKMSCYSSECEGKVTISSDWVYFKDSKAQSTGNKKHVMHF